MSIAEHSLSFEVDVNLFFFTVHVMLVCLTSYSDGQGRHSGGVWRSHQETWKGFPCCMWMRNYVVVGVSLSEPHIVLKCWDILLKIIILLNVIHLIVIDCHLHQINQTILLSLCYKQCIWASVEEAGIQLKIEVALQVNQRSNAKRIGYAARKNEIGSTVLASETCLTLLKFFCQVIDS